MIQGDFYVIRQPDHLANALQTISAIQPDPEKPMAVKVEPFKAKRSDLQNRYYWGWVLAQIEQELENRGIVIVCEDDREVPYTKDLLHEIFKTKLLTKEVINTTSKTGESRELILYYSTTELSSAQFSDYVERVRNFVWQFWKFNVPDPVGYYDQLAKELGLIRTDG